MTDAETTNVEVTYREAEPQKIAVEVNRWQSNFSYNTTYTFEMVGSTAELTSIKSDGDSYPVKANECTRDAARETVEKLPFVQGVVMIE
jgi:ribosomal protein L25 (general stress protein Ctc)